jgi:hypothetical protein
VAKKMRARESRGRDPRLLVFSIAMLISGIVGIIAALFHLLLPPLVGSIGFTLGGVLLLRARRFQGKRMAGHVLGGLLIAAVAAFAASFLPGS